MKIRIIQGNKGSGMTIFAVHLAERIRKLTGKKVLSKFTPDQEYKTFTPKEFTNAQDGKT